MRAPDFLPIQFIIIGGGVAGLTAAIALSRVGHRVTLLEQGDDFEETKLAGGCRISPNLTKIYYRWGMEKQFKELSVKSAYVRFARYESGSVTGIGEWVEEFKNESGGEFVSMHYADLRKLLHDTAVEHGAKIRSNAEVVSMSVRPERPSVTLASGEELDADVLVGADGLDSLSRAMMLGDADHEVLTHMVIYNVIVPAAKMHSDPDLANFVEQKNGTVFSWFGEVCGVMGFPTETQGRNEFALHVYAPGEARASSGQLEVGLHELLSSMEGCEPRYLCFRRLCGMASFTSQSLRLRKIAELASSVMVCPIIERPHLEDWVHPDGQLIVMGEAAHPLTPGSLYALSTAAGDGMTLGRLFYHIHRKDQINSFLSALQEISQKRVAEVQRATRTNPFAMALPPGIDRVRASDLPKKFEQEAQAMGAEDIAIAKTQDAIRQVFAYDPEDEADAWWVQWGILQERAARTVSNAFKVEVKKLHNT
ncbi:hypothetical protein AcV7_004175 [Taiwanofungus camphoratus]|nr:hypothetical protein AcV7_004175 [Antrodia cinnamomea]